MSNTPQLDETLYAHNGAIKSLHHKIWYQDCKLTPDELLGMEDTVSAKAKQAIIDWHNKQIESELKSIYGELGHIKAVRECIDDRLAERNKLKEQL